MKDRPFGQQRLGREEAFLHRQQVAVPQDHLQDGQPGVGAQHEEAIETGIGLDFRCIDGEPFTSRISEEAAVSGIADQRLALAFETGQQFGPGLGILAGLFGVAGQDIATPTEDDILIARSVSPFWRGMVSGTATPSSLITVVRTSTVERSRTPSI
jgi:hypothetical protein